MMPLTASGKRLRCWTRRAADNGIFRHAVIECCLARIYPISHSRRNKKSVAAGSVPRASRVLPLQARRVCVLGLCRYAVNGMQIVSCRYADDALSDP